MDWSDAIFHALLDVIIIKTQYYLEYLYMYLKSGTRWNSIPVHHTYVDSLKGYYCSTLSNAMGHTLILKNSLSKSVDTLGLLSAIYSIPEPRDKNQQQNIFLTIFGGFYEVSQKSEVKFAVTFRPIEFTLCIIELADLAKICMWRTQDHSVLRIGLSQDLHVKNPFCIKINFDNIYWVLRLDQVFVNINTC